MRAVSSIDLSSNSRSSSAAENPIQLCLPEIPFSGFHQCNSVTLPRNLPQYQFARDTLDEAIADFSVAYADQGEKDHEALKKAVRAGKLEVAHLA